MSAEAKSFPSTEEILSWVGGIEGFQRAFKARILETCPADELPQGTMTRTEMAYLSRRYNIAMFSLFQVPAGIIESMPAVSLADDDGRPLPPKAAKKAWILDRILNGLPS